MIDVDGARDLATVLVSNSSLEYLEIGYNRIRDEGLRVICNAIRENPKCNLRVLGLRNNFLSDKAFSSVLTLIKELPHLKIRKVFFKKNRVTDYQLGEHIKQSVEISKDFYSDIFEKECFSDEKTLARTVWVDKSSFTSQQLKDYFKKTHECGVVLNIRLRKGTDFPNKPKGHTFYMVEFADELSAQKSIILCSKRENQISGVFFWIRIAGTSTFFYSKDCKVKKS